jgi:biopolymer transport protein ExbB
VFELIKAGGWVMVPIILCSTVAFAIVLERLWSLQTRRVAPPNLVAQVWQWFKNGHLDHKRIQQLRAGSPLGRILAAGIANRNHDRTLMKEDIEDVGRHVVHELERYLNTLGTIAAVSPLLGLLGTVTGMIRAFSAISARGVSDPAVVSGGIAEALICTAAGLMVAIPALMAYRYLRGRIDTLVIAMEQEAFRLVEVIHGERDDEAPSAVRVAR